MGPIEIRLLGRFSVRRAGEEIPPGTLGGRLGRALLRFLVTRRGAFVAHDALAEALWPGRVPGDTAGSLKVLVARVRRGLGDPSLIATGSHGYSFVAGEECAVDGEAFLARLETGRRLFAEGRAGAALAELRAGLEMWAGDPLPEDAYDDWARPYRNRLMRARREALELGAAADLVSGDFHEATALAEAAVDEEPLREASHLLLVRALAASGDAAAALRAYDAFRGRLADELGLDPSPEADDLQARILRGEIGAPRAGPRAGARSATPRLSDPAIDELAFVGRDEEVATALSVLRGAAPGIVVVSGEAGLGKSRLLREVAARLGLPAIWGKAFLPEQEDPWGLARSLLSEALTLEPEVERALTDRAIRALADVLPELVEVRGPGEAQVDPESRRALAFEGGVRLLEAAAARGALLMVDDLQWGDASSLALLGRVARRVPSLGMICAYRREEVSPEGAVAAFLADLLAVPRQIVGLQLQPLSPEAVRHLVGDPSLGQAVAETTDGSPFAVAEVLRVLVARGAIRRDADRAWIPRTPGAAELAREVALAGRRRAIQTRVERQATARRHILKLLCLLGRETPARVLAAATGTPQVRILEDLDALARVGLVRLGERGWMTAHDVIVETVTEALESHERGSLHELLCRALRLEGSDPAELARHLAGAGDAEAAAEAYALAARKGLDRFASDEAEGLADTGLSLRPQPFVRAELLDVRAEARFRRGDLPGAREDLRGALGIEEAPSKRSRILSRMALLSSGSEDLARAEELVALALAEGVGDPDAGAEALLVGAIVDMNSNLLDRARARFDKALALFEQAGNASGIGRVLDGRAMGTWIEGRITDAADAFDRVATLFMTTGQLLRVVTPRGCRGACLMQMGRSEEALPQIDEARDLARMLGDSEGEAYVLMFRAQTLAALGRAEEAVACAERALEIAERLGHREWTAGSLWALGDANEATGHFDRAEAAYRRSLQVSGDRLPFWTSRAAARLASVLIVRGELRESEALVDHALSVGLPLSLYDARLSRAQLAIARGDRAAASLAAEAVAMAERGGYLAGPRRFRRVTALGPHPSG